MQAPEERMSFERVVAHSFLLPYTLPTTEYDNDCGARCELRDRYVAAPHVKRAVASGSSVSEIALPLRVLALTHSLAQAGALGTPQFFLLPSAQPALWGAPGPLQRHRSHAHLRYLPCTRPRQHRFHLPGARPARQVATRLSGGAGGSRCFFFTLAEERRAHTRGAFTMFLFTSLRPLPMAS